MPLVDMDPGPYITWYISYNGERQTVKNEFTAIFASADEGGYWAYCLEIPAVGQGETVEECQQNLRDAILLMLTDRREEERREAPAGSWEQVIEVEG
jgi:predicted RNase H-like HicB family nuclease